MVSLSDVLTNLKALLDRFYPRTDASNIKVQNGNTLIANTNKLKNGVIVTDGTTGEVVITPSISANTNMITGLSSVATSGVYSDLSGVPTSLNDFSKDNFTLPYGSVTGTPTNLSDFTNDLSSISWSQLASNTTKNGIVLTDNSGNLTASSYIPQNTIYIGTGNGLVKSGIVLTDSNGKLISSTSLPKATIILGTKSDDASKNVITNSDGKLTTEAKNNHSHGNLQSDGKIGSTATNNGIVLTDSSGKITASTNIPKNTIIVGTNNNTSMNVVTDGNGKITTEAKPTIPSASTTTPLADTNGGSIGNGTTWAKADHQHPLSDDYLQTVDETVGGTKDSTDPISSGAFYNTLHTVDPSTMWILVSSRILDSNNKHWGQKIWYHPLTGMVEMWLVTPYHSLGANYETVFRIQPNLETSTLNNLGLSTNIEDYLPHTVVHGIGRGKTSTGGAMNIIATLTNDTWTESGNSSKGVVYGRSVTGSTISSRRFDLYFTYRCKLGHRTTDFNNLDDTND